MRCLRKSFAEKYFSKNQIIGLLPLGFFANFAGKINEMTAKSLSRISFVMQSQTRQNGSISHPATSVSQIFKATHW